MNLIRTLASTIRLQTSNSFKLSSVFSNTKRFESTKDNQNNDDNVYKSEKLPPIPPKPLWQGDENTKAKDFIKNLPKSFKYGAAPRLRHQFIKGPPVIRLKRANKCANRRFFRIVLTNENLDNRDPHIEDLGSYDPLPNKDNQIVVALNLQRIKELMSKGVRVNGSVEKLLGLSGFLPVHPKSYLDAYRNRKTTESKLQVNTNEETA